MTRALTVLLLGLVGCSVAHPDTAVAPEPSVAALRDFDGDGFPDPRDVCPRVAGAAPVGCPAGADLLVLAAAGDACLKDQGGFGCEDGDSDGVPGRSDACARQAETHNGYLDHDGCPDELPADLARIAGTLRGVQFEPDQDVLKTSSVPALQRVVKVLQKYPDVRVEISGHLDGPTDGRDLSAARAGAVKTFIVAQGVDARRLETRGAGQDEPIDSHKTAAGRQRNRRVELTILPE